MIVEELVTNALSMRVRIVSPAKYARVGQVMREEVAQPVDTVVRRPCFLAVSVQAMDSDDAGARLAVERATGQKEAYSTVGLAPSATTCRPCTTAAAGPADAEDAEGSAGVCLCVSAYEREACLRDVPLPYSSSSTSQSVVASRCLKVCGVGRRMCSSIVREGCREAELRGGCGMLAVEAIEGAWSPLLSLAVRCSARSAPLNGA
jgi:hypothetical protein